MMSETERRFLQRAIATIMEPQLLKLGCQINYKADDTLDRNQRQLAANIGDVIDASLHDINL